MVIPQIIAIILCISSFTMLVLLVSAWKKRRNKKEAIYQYVKENTGIDKRKVKQMDIPNELRRIKKGSLEKNFEELFWPLVVVFYSSFLFLFLNKAQFIFWSASSVAILFAVAILIWTLAINDYSCTLTPAMQAKAVLWNEDFHKMLMAYTKKIFAFEDPINYYTEDISYEEEQKVIEEKSDMDEKGEVKKMRKELWRKQRAGLGEIIQTRKNLGLRAVDTINDPWDIVSDIDNIHQEKNIFLPKFMRGIYWVGIPPFYKIYYYRFRWASSEQKYDEKIGGLVTRPITVDRSLNYITLKDDVYNMTVESCETNEAIPLNIEITLTINVTNPKKALFKIQKWLEAVINQIGPKVRKFVGGQGYFQLIQAKQRETSLPDYRGEKLLSDKNLEFILTAIRLIYGVNVKRVQIKELNPATKEAEDFIRASIQEFISARLAAGWKKETEGYKEKFGVIASKRGGPEMYMMEQLAKLVNLSALSFGEGGLIQTAKVVDTTGSTMQKKGGGEKK